MNHASPRTISDREFAFGTRQLEQYLPPIEDVPAPFRDPSNPWRQVATHARTRGMGHAPVFIAKRGIDIEVALRHLGGAMFSPIADVEHRDAGVAFLMAQWFDAIALERGPSATHRASTLH